ncbi:hypothetical protein CROQUDRAFT_95027 [Cronartium quercuum f. sp. fusiforme G11]|uniref:Uncharacterized protein n=1 Tax=Cronartium quercuum f. sp. fusiforme G11 TaxID=708437 RepID=A0A9P6NEF0_9BASI|nr:hypothetical protein CROQUDRAFT_95027 [Cronartium quercuum f. sp. fusiforme G11]
MDERFVDTRHDLLTLHLSRHPFARMVRSNAHLGFTLAGLQPFEDWVKGGWPSPNLLVGVAGKSRTIPKRTSKASCARPTNPRLHLSPSLRASQKGLAELTGLPMAYLSLVHLLRGALSSRSAKASGMMFQFGSTVYHEIFWVSLECDDDSVMGLFYPLCSEWSSPGNLAELRLKLHQLDLIGKGPIALLIPNTDPSLTNCHVSQCRMNSPKCFEKNLTFILNQLQTIERGLTGLSSLPSNRFECARESPFGGCVRAYMRWFYETLEPTNTYVHSRRAAGVNCGTPSGWRINSHTRCHRPPPIAPT